MDFLLLNLNPKGHPLKINEGGQWQSPKNIKSHRTRFLKEVMKVKKIQPENHKYCKTHNFIKSFLSISFDKALCLNMIKWHLQSAFEILTSTNRAGVVKLYAKQRFSKEIKMSYNVLTFSIKFFEKSCKLFLNLIEHNVYEELKCLIMYDHKESFWVIQFHIMEVSH